MFGIPTKKDVRELKEVISTLQQKSYSPTVHWNSQGNSIPLFDFSDANEIKTAISSVPELSSVINYLGKSFSLGQYKIIKDNKVIDNSKLYDLFSKPHPIYNGSEFKQSFAENLFSYGVAYIYINKPAVTTSGMFILPSWSVKPYVDNTTHKNLRDATKLSDIIKYLEIESNGKSFELPIDNVLIITLNTTISIKDKYLIYESPLKPLEKALMVTPAMYDSMQNLMNNGGMKGFIANKSTDSGGFVPIDPKDKKELQKAFKNYGSKSNQYDLAFTNADLNYIPITSRIKDMLIPEQQKMIKTIIADVLGFDTAILNNDNANKYANYKEARKSMFTETLIPAANNYSFALSSYFNEQINLDFSEIDVFSEDEKLKAETTNLESTLIINLNNAVLSGSMDRNNAIEFLVLNGYEQLTAQKLIK